MIHIYLHLFALVGTFQVQTSHMSCKILFTFFRTFIHHQFFCGFFSTHVYLRIHKMSQSPK